MDLTMKDLEGIGCGPSTKMAFIELVKQNADLTLIRSSKGALLEFDNGEYFAYITENGCDIPSQSAQAKRRKVNGQPLITPRVDEEDKPHNSSKGKGMILETPYRPGFVDDGSLEALKMAVDKELSEVSNALYVTTERTADTITRIDKLEISGDTQYGELVAKIEEVDKVSKEGDVALASRITTISAEVGDNKSAITTESEARAEADRVITTRVDNILGAMEGDLGPLVGQIQTDLRVLADVDGVLSTRIDTVSAEYKAADETIKASVKNEETARVTADQALASQVSTVESKLGQDIAAVQQYATTEINKVDGKVDANGNAINSINAKWGVQVNVNNKVTGIQLNNDGNSSSFSVQADRFTVSDGSNTTAAPFEVVGTNTRIKSAYVQSLQSDTWDGANNGWAITRDGYAKFNNVHVRGTIDATNGTFDNVVIRNSCVYQGSITSDQIQDTAVTALTKASNTINTSTGVGGTTIDQVLCTGNVAIARGYARTIQFTYPGAISVRGTKGGSGSKQLIVKLVLRYQGNVISEAVHANTNTSSDYSYFMGGTVVGTIPANTTGALQVNAYLYFQDTSGLAMSAITQVSQFSIFKVSSELSA